MTQNYARLGNDEVELGPGDAPIEDLLSRRRIESWLGALLQADHLSLLVGNGLSTAIGRVVGQDPPSMAAHLEAGDASAALREHAAAAATKAGRDHNLEDEIRSALALLAGLEVLGEPRSELRQSIDDAMTGLVSGVFAYEAKLREESATNSDAGVEATRLLQRFLLPLASRGAGRDRLNVFTTNYDRTIEFASDLLGIRLIDRFVGHLEPAFSASRLNVDMHYSPPGIRGEPRYLEGVVRYAKLHGSVDWRSAGDRITRRPLPFGGQADAVPDNPSTSVLIYPNPAKDVETLAYPYAELFRDFAAAICQPNSVLVTYGYGFGDSHINRIIRDMLRIHSTHLAVVSYGQLSALDHFKRDYFPSNQTTELVGPALGALPQFVDFVPSIVSAELLDTQARQAEASARLRNALEDSDQHANESVS